MTPKQALVNLKTSTFGSRLPTSSTHRNLKKSRCSGLMLTFRKAFSMSEIKTTFFKRNLNNMSINIGNKDGPASRHSFSLPLASSRLNEKCSGHKLFDPVYTMPVEFENGIKKCRFGLPFTRCRQNFQILPAEFCFG